LSAIARLLKHTFVYGLATILPRLLTVLLTPLLTGYLPAVDFGEVSLVFTWIILANVLLTYGMETAFFRFYNEKDQQEKALSTSLWSLTITTVTFAIIAFLCLEQIESFTQISAMYWRWVIGIVAFDTLMVIPFAFMRAQAKSTRYAIIKLINVVISTGTSVLFFVWLQDLPLINQYLPSDKKELFFIAFFAASVITFLVVARPYFNRIVFSAKLYKRMLRYGLPVLVAGIAFAINETFDKLLLQYLLPESTAKAQVGIYTACYRLAIGMTLYATAFKLGIEPFFFSQAKHKNAEKQYAQITKFFVIFGALALMSYMILIDVIKGILIPNPAYWEAIKITPIVLYAFFFFGIYQTLSVWYKVTDKTKYGAYISIIGAVLTLLINIIGIPLFGYVASATATCVAYGAMLVISYILSRKHMLIPYDVKGILLYLTLGIGFSAVFFYLLRENLAIGSLSLYLAGIALLSVLIAIIVIREGRTLRKLMTFRKK